MAFMIPEYSQEVFISWEDKDGEYHLCPLEYYEEEKGDTDHEEHRDKWFVCLSAPGYMDCTDWCGPYETKEEAMREVVTMWEVCPHCGESLEY